jgi:hypothetical protein
VNRGKSLVLKTYTNSILVLTPGGEFRRLKWRGPLPQPGEELDLTAKARVAWFPAALAAVLLLVAVLPLNALAARPAAYIALDINPSLELAVGRNGLVKSGKGLDADGERLLSEVQVVGLEPPAAVESLVRQAAVDGYLGGNPDDVVLLTRVELTKNSSVAVEELEAATRRALETSDCVAFVSVEEASTGELKEARGAGLSLNKLRLVKKLEQQLPPGLAKGKVKENAKEQGIKQILSSAGKKVPEVFANGRVQGKSKEADKKNKPKEEHGNRPALPPGQAVATAAREKEKPAKAQNKKENSQQEKPDKTVRPEGKGKSGATEKGAQPPDNKKPPGQSGAKRKK